MARCSQTGIYTLFPPVDFNCVCCQSRWLSRGNRSEQCYSTRYLARVLHSITIPQHSDIETLEILFLFIARLDEVQKNLCTTPGVGVHIYVKVFKTSYFVNHSTNLVRIWYNDRYRSKVSISNTLLWPIGHTGQKQGQRSVLRKTMCSLQRTQF